MAVYSCSFMTGWIGLHIEPRLLATIILYIQIPETSLLRTHIANR